MSNQNQEQEQVVVRDPVAYPRYPARPARAARRVYTLLPVDHEDSTHTGTTIASDR